MFQGVEHTAIASPNPEKLANWYVDHLGFYINFAYAGNFFVKAPNGSILEIIPAEGSRRPAEDGEQQESPASVILPSPSTTSEAAHYAT